MEVMLAMPVLLHQEPSLDPISFPDQPMYKNIHMPDQLSHITVPSTELLDTVKFK
jgi:hypothetical protein